MTTTTTTTALAQVLREAVAGMGFLSHTQLCVLAKEDRLRPVLVRCGGCRFIAPAQDATHIMEALTADGDYVRDVSLPGDDPAMLEAERGAKL